MRRNILASTTSYYAYRGHYLKSDVSSLRLHSATKLPIHTRCYDKQFKRPSEAGAHPAQSSLRRKSARIFRPYILDCNSNSPSYTLPLHMWCEGGFPVGGLAPWWHGLRWTIRTIVRISWRILWPAFQTDHWGPCRTFRNYSDRPDEILEGSDLLSFIEQDSKKSSFAVQELSKLSLDEQPVLQCF